MKDSHSPSPLYSLLKSLLEKLRSILLCCSGSKYKRLDKKIEKKMIELRKSSSPQRNLKSIDSVIMRFPHFNEGLKTAKRVFDQYDEDSNGVIDFEELKRSLRRLQLNLLEEEIKELFQSCDIDRSGGMQFTEFIVLLCLIYLLEESSSHTKMSTLDDPQLEEIFNNLIEIFMFLDKNGDGKLNKKDMVKSMNEAYVRERSPAHITKHRFREMDWDKNGEVSFREFLFAFLKWIGIDMEDLTYVDE